MTTVAENISSGGFDWQRQPRAAAVIHEIVRECCDRSAAIEEFARRLRRETGTRLSDWLDHLALAPAQRWAPRLAQAGFVPAKREPSVWEHPGGLFPSLVLHDAPVLRLAVRVESVADFLAAHRIDGRTPIQGAPLAPLRKAVVSAESGVEWWVVERHGDRRWTPPEVSPDQTQAVLHFHEAFRRRRRRFDHEESGFEHATELIRAAAAELGVDWTCDLFFAAEREHWTRRNAAARVQKARQDALGLGWANHDHHTYRSSRRWFARLVAVLEELGLVCRERFYAGREAGWGAQVLEQPAAGIVVFADVDLAPHEVSGDFANEPLPAGEGFGTVGLWCALHGEAFFEAGMHHLECRFDFDAAREQLGEAGIRTMKPFTELPYLRQAFTEGEVWRVEPERIDAAVAHGAIAAEQAAQFRSGAIGSHLEILQRDEGYKGFNQAGINEIIRATDPRRCAS